MTSYQPGIPTGTVNLDVDYQNIQGNFQQLDTTYGTDHVAYSQATNNGYHNIIRLVPHAIPSAISGIGQFFTQTINDGINSDQALYYLSGGNRQVQLTRNFQPTNGINGSSFLPGGLILNWGTATINTLGTPTNITFNQAVTSGVYSITIGCINTGGNSPSANNVFIKDGSVTNSGFTVTNSSSGTVTKIYWMAIGT